MSPATAKRVAELPYVRWIGSYQAAHRLDDTVEAVGHRVDPCPVTDNK